MNFIIIGPCIIKPFLSAFYKGKFIAHTEVFMRGELKGVL
jgi:hypothetical protein